MTASPALTVAVTGATGYIGGYVCQALLHAGCIAVPLVRQRSAAVDSKFIGCATPRVTGDLAHAVDWGSLLHDIDVVVHTAAVVHGRLADPSARVHEVNTEATLALAEAAVATGVSRFVFMSSVGVYGRHAPENRVTEADTCAPIEPYSMAKREAELRLESSGVSDAMQVAIVRPPMVYGPHCPGNLRTLAKLIPGRVAAPLGGLDGRRNLVGVQSLADAMVRVVTDQGDVSGIWNIAEPDEPSVPDIVKALGQGLHGKPVFVSSLPKAGLKLLSALVGKSDLFEKLDSPFLVDASRFRERFAWNPQSSTLDGIKTVGESYSAERVHGRP